MFFVVVSGCGVPHAEHQQVLNRLAAEQTAHAETRIAHAETKKELQTEQAAHASTEKELQTERAAHAKERAAHTSTEKELQTEQAAHAKERTAHTSTEKELQTEQAAHAKERTAHAETRIAHAETKKELQTEQAAHAKERAAHTSTEKRLQTERAAHAKERAAHTSTEKRLQTERAAHAEKQKKLEALQRVKLPTAAVYLNLGRIRVNLAIIKWNQGKKREAKELYTQAIVSLEKVIDIQPSADAHYYLARAHYELRDFVSACNEVKNALALAKGRHPKAEELKNALANCD